MISTLNFGENSLFILIFFFIGLLFFYNSFLLLKQKRFIENTPTAKIRSLALGLVEIVGKAIPGPKLDYDMSKNNFLAWSKLSINVIFSINPISPFTKRECIYYDVSIEQYNKGKKEGKWVLIHKKYYANPFYVMDDTGKMLIKTYKASFDAKQSFNFESRMFKELSPDLIKYMSENNVKYESFFNIKKRLRFTERAIFVNDDVYVIGNAMSSGVDSAVGHEKLFIGKKSLFDFLLISNKSEKELLKSFNGKIILFFIIGLVLCVISFAIFLSMSKII